MAESFLRRKPESARALVEAIEAAVALGQLRPDERLPPVRTLAEASGLAPNTVAAAYRTLNQRGIVVGRGRSGTFITGRPPLAAPADHAPPPGTTDISSGAPDPLLLPPLRPVLDVIDVTPVLYGAEPLDEALRPWALRWAVPAGIAVERVAVVGGALDGVERVLAAHSRPGDRVAVEDPGYAPVFDLLAALGLVAVPVCVDDDGPLPDALDAALGHDVRALVCSPRAQNPTGAALQEPRAAVLRAVLADRPEVVVIEDDHAGPVAGAPRISLIDAERAHWASVASVSKSLGPDLRVAFLAADPTTLDRVEGRQQLGTGWVSHLLQRTVAGVLDRPDTAGRLEIAAARYGARRAALVDRLREEGIAAHGRTGMNVWVPVAAESPVLTALARRGWWARAGDRYRMVSGPAVRVSVGALTDDEALRLAEDLVTVLRTNTGGRRTG